MGVFLDEVPAVLGFVGCYEHGCCLDRTEDCALEEVAKDVGREACWFFLASVSGYPGNKKLTLAREPLLCHGRLISLDETG